MQYRPFFLCSMKPPRFLKISVVYLRSTEPSYQISISTILVCSNEPDKALNSTNEALFQLPSFPGAKSCGLWFQIFEIHFLKCPSLFLFWRYEKYFLEILEIFLMFLFLSWIILFTMFCLLIRNCLGNIYVKKWNQNKIYSNR